MMRRKQPIVLVGGIHGAGKSHLSRVLADEIGGVQITASELLLDAGSNKVANDLARNQERILAALENKLQRATRPVILDGHFVLRTRDGRIQKIDLVFFERLSPSALIVLDTPSAIVQSRLETRDRTFESEKSLRRLGAAEIAHARHVSLELGIPLQVTHEPDPQEHVAKFLKHTLSLAD